MLEIVLSLSFDPIEEISSIHRAKILEAFSHLERILRSLEFLWHC